MRPLLAAAMLVVSASALAQNAAPPARHGPELFDFWLGDWDLTWTADEGRTGHGHNHVAKILDGQVIEENFEEMPDGKTPPLKGRSLSVLHKASGVWKQSWFDNQGGFFAFTAQVDGAKRLFVTEMREVEGRRTAQRMIFHSITKDSLTWDWERTVDGGSTWTLLWRIQYQRRTP